MPETSSFIDALGQVAQILLLITFLATINERLVQFLAKPIVSAWMRFSRLVPYVATLFAIAIAFAFNLDVFSPLVTALGFTLTWKWAGILFTGLLMGGGSNLIHDVWPKS